METPKMHPVKSSNIAAVGHHSLAGKPASLYIRFVNGSTFRYDGVSRDAFEALKNAESVGKHFYANIRQHFKGIKVDGDH